MYIPNNGNKVIIENERELWKKLILSFKNPSDFLYWAILFQMSFV